MMLAEVLPNPNSPAAFGWVIIALAGLITAGGGLIFGIRKITGVDQLSSRVDDLHASLNEQARQFAILSTNLQNLTAQMTHLVERLERAEVRGYQK